MCCSCLSSIVSNNNKERIIFFGLKWQYSIFIFFTILTQEDSKDFYKFTQKFNVFKPNITAYWLLNLCKQKGTFSLTLSGIKYYFLITR